VSYVAAWRPVGSALKPRGAGIDTGKEDTQDGEGRGRSSSAKPRLKGGIRSALRLEHVRVVGDLGSRVRCVGVPMGGLGLDANLSYLQTCIELGADVLIGGEADEYGFTFAADADVRPTTREREPGDH
jgi:hypothetical protein